jgi:integrase
MTNLRLRYVHSFVDRHGRARFYFRHRGNRWPLPAPGTQGFHEAYEACMARLKSGPAPDRVAFLPGSLAWAIEKFIASPEYKARAPATRAADRRLYDELKRHAGTGLLKDLRPRHVKAIRDHFRTTFTASIADAAIARLSVLWDYADEHLQVDIADNPTHGIRRVHKGQTEREPWPDDVLERFENEAPSALRVAFLLALYTGQRRSDLVKMKWAQFDGDSIDVKQTKTGQPLTIPCHRRLRETLDKLPRRQSEYILLGERGRPLGADSLSMAFRRMLARLGIKGYSIHGLRKNAAKALADAGCDPRQIMAITGHRTFAMAFHYAKRADQRLAARAAMDKWEAAESGKPVNIRGRK